jgi:hypothetical protein
VTGSLTTTTISRICSRPAALGRHTWERLWYRMRRPAVREWHATSRSCLLGAGEDLREVAEACRKLFPDPAGARIHQADLICQHVFDLLGSGPTRLSPPGSSYHPIDWHTDFKSGYRWDPQEFHRRVRYGHVRGVDIKVPWELSRFQHLSVLGQAYALTGNPAYSAQFADQIDDWIRSNPVGFGVNWMCTMDVAIRAANWLAAGEYFLAGGALKAGFLRRFYSSLYEHGRFIERHLERRRVTTNHYLADIVGLLSLAVYCPFFAASGKWLRFCIRELTEEMNNQVYADGCHFESSTCYHGLALEMFFFATVLAVRRVRESAGESDRQVAERVFGAAYIERLHGMFLTVLHLLKPSGRMPQIGDNDSGRLYTLRARSVLDMRHLLTLGAIFFEDSGLKVGEFGCGEEALWVFGRRGYDVWQRLEGRSVTTIGNRSFPQAGWYVIRQGFDYCLVSCGPHGPHGIGGHAHNDKLSFELMLNGRDVVVDPGTYLYTSAPDLRNRFRSTSYHNTAILQGCEQNELPADVFRLPDRVHVRRAELQETAQGTDFTGEIEYAGIVHQRIIGFERKPRHWRIRDCLSGPRPLRADLKFHLAPQVSRCAERLCDRESGEPLALLEAQGGSVQIQPYCYSPEYGVCVPASCISIRIPNLTCTTVVTAISPVPGAPTGPGTPPDEVPT